MMAFKFENLEVWKEAVEMAEQIHQVAVKFPKDFDAVYTRMDRLIMRIQALRKTLN